MDEAPATSGFFLFVPDGAVGDADRLQRIFAQPVRGWIPDLRGVGADIAGAELLTLWDEVVEAWLSQTHNNLSPVTLCAPIHETQAAERFDVEWTTTYWLLRHVRDTARAELPCTTDPLWIELDEHAETLYNARAGHWRKYGHDPYPHLWLQHHQD